MTSATGRMTNFGMLHRIVNRQIPEMTSLARIGEIEGNPSDEAQLKKMNLLELVEKLGSAHTCATINASVVGPQLAGSSSIMDIAYSLQPGLASLYALSSGCGETLRQSLPRDTIFSSLARLSAGKAFS